MMRLVSRGFLGMSPPLLPEYLPTLNQRDFVSLLARPASAVDQRRFTTARASTFDFSMRTDSSRTPPTLIRTKLSPCRTYSAPVIGVPTQYASSPSPSIRRGLRVSSSPSGSGFCAFLPAARILSSSISGAWNCFRQNLRGANAESLTEEGVANATLTDFAKLVVWKRHPEISISPFGWTLALVSFTGSPWTASISAAVSRIHASFLPLAEVAASLLIPFRGERPGACLAGSAIAHKKKPQTTIRIANL